MSRDTVRERLAANASGVAATAVTGIWLAALFLDFSWWLAFMLFGYVVIVPVVSILFDEEGTDEAIGREGLGGDERARDAASGPDALERLRTRYAEGELTDEQFERKLDRLLETETPEDAAEWSERRREAAREGRERERER